MAERDRVINALQELDFDFKLGKIPRKTIRFNAPSFCNWAPAILKKLDSQLSASAPDKEDGTAESRLEKAAAARQADASGKPDRVTDDQIELMLAARRKARKTNLPDFVPLW